ncbi:septum site-determining protein MinD [Candidatus Pacearchaeota archaeon CG10_big_fil_rev_8_21_14_0_10_32_42]|nr:MAG: septum site-determining protein MinD [Candidatus Pacearchaeota archaeon CG10_big_fil_rev_8_21_14_0_10_32_42]
MKRLIVIASGKGGVGKTTTAINLGAAINYFNRDVLIIDANMSTPNVGIHLNSPEVPINLNHVLQKKAHPFEAVYTHESGIKIIPSSLSIKELKKIKMENLKNFKEEFKNLAEFVILDCSAGLGKEAIHTMELADEIILVSNPEMPSITDALKTIKIAEEMKKNVIGIIMTRVRKNKDELPPETVKEMLEIPVIGMIPEDSLVQNALKNKKPLVFLHPKSKSARAYKEIAARLIDEEYDSDADKPTLWEKVKFIFEKN